MVPGIAGRVGPRLRVGPPANSISASNFRGEQPLKINGRLNEVFAEDFRRELAEIQNPTVRHLFILAKASHLIHFHISEYKTLIAAADLSGHYGVGVLLESCLADKLAFVERTRRLIQNIAATKVAEKITARSVA